MTHSGFFAFVCSYFVLAVPCKRQAFDEIAINYQPRTLAAFCTHMPFQLC